VDTLSPAGRVDLHEAPWVQDRPHGRRRVAHKKCTPTKAPPSLTTLPVFINLVMTPALSMLPPCHFCLFREGEDTLTGPTIFCTHVFSVSSPKKKTICRPKNPWNCRVVRKLPAAFPLVSLYPPVDLTLVLSADDAFTLYTVLPSLLRGVGMETTNGM